LSKPAAFWHTATLFIFCPYFLVLPDSFSEKIEFFGFVLPNCSLVRRNLVLTPRPC